MMGERSRRELSLGSGVIVSPDGYILKNNHVIGQQGRGSQVTVVFGDKREVRAQVVGYDDWTDIALLKVNLASLPVIPWGDSSKLKVAEWVLAIGNPFQLSQTVTLGIVSALGRANIGAATYEDFIQTDAAINPGNSGGALVNARGERIGINTAIYSQSGGYQGIGFAVPSNLARRVMDDLIRYGQVRRGWLGAMDVIPLTSQLAEQLGVTGEQGAVVARMSRASAAYQAGIRPGDVITSFNGTRVTDSAHFLRLLADAPIGSMAAVGIERGGRHTELKVRVEQTESRRRRVQ
jgi:serine protease Do